MTPEEKQLLMIDLYPRSPYGVKVWRQGGDYVVSSIDIENQRVYLKVDFKAARGWWFDIEEVKPYLRSMESMTDGEIDKMWEVYENNPAAEGSSKITDLLNKWGLDHHHLIEKGLAAEAPDGMYNRIDMMTLEEAIKHCEEKSCDNTQCAMEHRQLAEWLKELQQYRKNKDDKCISPEEGDIVVNRYGEISVFESWGHHPDGGSFNDRSYFFAKCTLEGDDYDDYDCHPDSEGLRYATPEEIRRIMPYILKEKV